MNKLFFAIHLLWTLKKQFIICSREIINTLGKAYQALTHCGLGCFEPKYFEDEQCQLNSSVESKEHSMDKTRQFDDMELFTD